MQEVIHKHSALMSQRDKKIEHLSADVQSWKISYIFGWIVCKQIAHSTFTHYFESKKNCWTIIKYVPQDDFKPQWQWFSWFKGLKQLFRHGEGVEVTEKTLIFCFLDDVSEVLETMQATNNIVEDWSYSWRSFCT